MLEIEAQDLTNVDILKVDSSLRPMHGSYWELEVTPSSHWDEEYLTSQGMKEFLQAEWTVTGSSNRTGLRLEGPEIGWARSDGGEGGGHPSNVLDHGEH